MRTPRPQFPPKVPTAADAKLEQALNDLRHRLVWKDADRVYERRRYLACVLLAPWLLSNISENLALDLFAVCFVLSLRDQAARSRYGATRSLLDAYWHGGWLKKYTVTKIDISPRLKTQAISTPRPPPALQKKPKLGRYDIAAIAVGTVGKTVYVIQVPSTWRHFMKYKRELYCFPKEPEDSPQNQLPLVAAALALSGNSQLRNKVDEDSKRILKEMTQLMDSYHFLLKADERKTKISLGKTMVQLAAFGLFTYTDWSWKKRRKCDSNEAAGI